MSVIRFLETMGGDAAMSGLSYSAYASAVSALSADDRTTNALLSRDAKILAGILGGRDSMTCAIFVPEEQSEAQEDVQEIAEVRQLNC